MENIESKSAWVTRRLFLNGHFVATCFPPCLISVFIMGTEFGHKLNLGIGPSRVIPVIREETYR
nr:hypothetical protein Iba_chr05aCG2670 [Ipomoea batatas]